jgi:amino acid adenylation domain-containing protein
MTSPASSAVGSSLDAPDVLSAILDFSRRQPSRKCVADLDRELSYGELADEAGHVAAALRDLGAAPGTRVALLIGNSVDFVVAAMACMWVGAAFVPVSVSDPPERRASIVTDCNPVVVVVTGRSPGLDTRAPVVDLRSLADQPGVAPSPVGDHDCVAYCIYTSGTTGAPKGVMISRSAFSTSVAAIGRLQYNDEASRALCVSPVHFDGSFSLIFPTLYFGGYLVIPDRESLSFPRSYFNALRRHQINTVSFSPSFLRLLMTAGGLRALADTDVDVLGLGGEAVSTGEVRSIWEAKPSVRVFNRYGPTETAISVSDLELTPEMLADGYVPIGPPHPGTSFHLVGADGMPVSSLGEPGELYVGGVQLMNGYLGAPELTSSVLRSDVVAGRTLYKTGDLVRLDRHGRWEFLGRTDSVVKHRGVRVSLVEVSEQLGRIEGVLAATASTFDDDGDLGVAAFVVADPAASPLQIRDRAADLLPAAMLPDRLVLVEEFPLNASSKVDQSRLLSDAGLTPWLPQPTGQVTGTTTEP